MEEKSFDIVVVGAGPGGYVAAIRAAQLGMKAAIVEANHMGGICLNWGCIPTKALLRSAEIYNNIKHAEEFGFKVEGVKVDFDKIIKRSRDVASKLASGISLLMKKNKITVFDGYGSLAGKGKIKVEKDGDKQIIAAKHIILATGARARELPSLKPDGKQILTYKEAMVMDKLPKSLLVVGSGAIGIEFASFYNNLGVDVTVVEIADRVMPVEDSEISKIAQKEFEKQGIKIKLNTAVVKLEKSKNSVKASLKSGDDSSEIEAEKVIMAVGIVPNSQNLGLEGTKVELDNQGHIKTDGWMATGEQGVYAIGDVAGAPWLAHKASHEAVICVEKISGKHVHPMKKENIPGCTYCTPQVASVGLTEDKARQSGKNIKVGRFPYVGNGKAIALGETEGLVKTIFDADSGELLGAHMVGAEVTEMINGFLVGKTMEATELDFMHTIFPHPTLSEMMHESVLSALDQALHI